MENEDKRKYNRTNHACPWCGAVLPNTYLGNHVRKWHDANYKPQNKMTGVEKMEFKASHYNYESMDPIAIKEKEEAKKIAEKYNNLVKNADKTAEEWIKKHG